MSTTSSTYSNVRKITVLGVAGVAAIYGAVKLVGFARKYQKKKQALRYENDVLKARKHLQYKSQEICNHDQKVDLNIEKHAIVRQMNDVQGQIDTLANTLVSHQSKLVDTEMKLCEFEENKQKAMQQLDQMREDGQAYFEVTSDELKQINKDFIKGQQGQLRDYYEAKQRKLDEKFKADKQEMKNLMAADMDAIKAQQDEQLKRDIEMVKTKLVLK